MSASPSIEVTTSGSTTGPDPSPSPVTLAIQTEPKDVREGAAVAAEIEKQHVVKDEELVWYFAIGSMINPTSLNLRNLFPRESKPGVVYGWKLVFRGGGGMADIDEGTPEDHFHGVVHHITKTEMLHLDSIESIYNRVPVRVQTYDGAIIEATAYKMDQKRLDPFGPNALPGERYIDIIMRGCRHYGVKQEYIDWLSKQPVTPRKKVSEYRIVPLPPSNVIIPLAELKAGTGVDGAPLLASMNGKVLKWVEPLTNDTVRQTYEWSRSRWGGTEMACAVAKTLYEPLYPIPTCFEEMAQDARGWAEELFVGFTTRGKPYDPTSDRIGNWQVIGWLEGSTPSGSREQSQQLSSPTTAQQ